MKKIVVLGCTGSVGRQTIEVVRRHKERFRVIGMAAGSSWEEVAKQAEQVNPERIAIHDPQAAAKLREALAANPRTASIEVVEGQAGVLEIACMEADMAVIALVGIAGLVPTLRAIENGMDIAFVNKETLVVGGELVMATARRYGSRLLPVDSEHSALFQCLTGEDPAKIARLILTTSGGPFRTWSEERIPGATVREALNHPTWNMGSKITIDSATLMNKGFEVIEAYHLFAVDWSRIDVIVHPQSVIHSMVEFMDGAVMAQLGTPDMKVPIQYALSYPDRLGPAWKRLDFTQTAALTFEQPRRAVFPCLDFGYQAGKTGGTMPCALNAANEIAVDMFLKEKIPFGAIPRIIEKTMVEHAFIAHPKLNDLLETDRACRARARELGAREPVSTS
jgi:1-deoxy-D-xylulose-5-phosphate reductoisomerase